MFVSNTWVVVTPRYGVHNTASRDTESACALIWMQSVDVLMRTSRAQNACVFEASSVTLDNLVEGLTEGGFVERSGTWYPSNSLVMP